MCQLAWRSGCSAADRTITSSGGSAADVPPSAATGAAVESLRALQRIRSSAARLRAWRVTGVAFGTREHRAQRPASAARSPSGRRSCAAGRTKKPATPVTGKGRRVFQPALPAWPCCVRDGRPSRGETPVPRRLDAQRDSLAPHSGETPRPTGTWPPRRQRPIHQSGPYIGRRPSGTRSLHRKAVR